MTLAAERHVGSILAPTAVYPVVAGMCNGRLTHSRRYEAVLVGQASDGRPILAVAPCRAVGSLGRKLAILRGQASDGLPILATHCCPADVEALYYGYPYYADYAPANLGGPACGCPYVPAVLYATFDYPYPDSGCVLNGRTFELRREASICGVPNPSAIWHNYDLIVNRGDPVYDVRVRITLTCQEPSFWTLAALVQIVNRGDGPCDPPVGGDCVRADLTVSTVHCSPFELVFCPFQMQADNPSNDCHQAGAWCHSEEYCVTVTE